MIAGASSSISQASIAVISSAASLSGCQCLKMPQRVMFLPSLFRTREANAHLSWLYRSPELHSHVDACIADKIS
jgi:hypothetical protein